MTTLTGHGYEIHRTIFNSDEIDLLKSEADRIANEASSACVRHLRDRSITFRELSFAGKIHALLSTEDLRPVRSILFDKTPTENWPVAGRRDLTSCTNSQAACEGYGPWSVKDGIPHVQPPVELLKTMVTARIHLDPTNSENGALMLIPGSHLHGRLSQSAIVELTADAADICECDRGDVLLMSPLILHSCRLAALQRFNHRPQHIPINRRRIIKIHPIPFRPRQMREIPVKMIETQVRRLIAKTTRQFRRQPGFTGSTTSHYSDQSHILHAVFIYQTAPLPSIFRFRFI